MIPSYYTNDLYLFSIQQWVQMYSPLYIAYIYGILAAPTSTLPIPPTFLLSSLQFLETLIAVSSGSFRRK